ncbi:MAG: hypothetical protein A2Z06_01355 [Candidatus Glassbacteria bacterium RBG_16_58_8]|uniref:DUF736 domain-containing protein n=1 Tax=Candidatus Glassbacteria bacterium RBG_16_58_8 TaxID=1817866 RepID=A0A1F5YCU5_9BACT|nr:MAG: hypothetical protein A2Z06_01355 [Candidatus Glassbacteria bacterium RBG_16_58_8]
MEGIRLTGLWKNKDKNGGTFLSGNLNSVTSLLVFPNTRKKEGGKDPDFYLYLKQNERPPEKKASRPDQEDPF